MSKNRSFAELINMSDDQQPLVVRDSVRCRKQCFCGHVIEVAAETVRTARQRARAQYELHYQEQHGDVGGA